MADIRSYIKDNLLDPLRLYPTAIQDTMLELITERLEELYNYTLLFPEIVTPTKSRFDILRVIADQFLFTIREDADLQEQIDILTNILQVYNQRGSIDTIEHLWKYYGGELPKDLQIVIPSYNLFKWNRSSYSGNHVFQDGDTNRTGAYEIKLKNTMYPVADLKKFLLKELVAAGNYIYFTNDVNVEVLDGIYNTTQWNSLDIQLEVPETYTGLIYSGGSSSALSGYYDTIRANYFKLLKESPDSEEFQEAAHLYSLLSTPVIEAKFSGKENLYMSISKLIDSLIDSPYKYDVDTLGFYTNYYSPNISIVEGPIVISEDNILTIFPEVYSTYDNSDYFTQLDLYNANNKRIKEREYFVLGGDSLLGEMHYDVIV